jgi:two-component system, NtrC family, C4-dicarboxylate transport response regulator DctD
MLFAVFMGCAAERLKRDEPVLTPAIWRRLKDHDWPGNVRELWHFAENVVLGLEGAGYESLQIEGPSDLKSQMALYEAALIENSLSKARGDVRSAIAALNLPRKTFYDKVKRLGVDLAQFKNGER